MTCDVWFQHENFENDDLGEMTLAQVIEYFNGLDWAAVFDKFEKELNEKEDCCPPGFGMTRDDKSYFHLYMDDPASWELMLSLKRESRFLGIFPKPARERSYRVISLKNLPELIELFFDGDYEKLIQECDLKLS